MNKRELRRLAREYVGTTLTREDAPDWPHRHGVSDADLTVFMDEVYAIGLKYLKLAERMKPIPAGGNPT